MIRTRAVAQTVAIFSLILAAALVLAPAPAGAAQGSGNPVLAVSPGTLKSGPSATVTVTGTDYLVPPHAPGLSVFGGVYVFFGWVRPGAAAWGPSARNSTGNNGVFGVTYSYRGDGGNASTRDDGSGTMRFVSFTPGGTSGDATDFHMDDNGNWSTTVKIPSSSYTYRDASGAKRTVDCLEVRCGVFTIGAHGKSSVTNERFTPITFTPPPPTPTTRPTSSQGTTTPTTQPPVTPTTAPVGGGSLVPATTAPTSPAPTTATTTPRPSTTKAPATTTTTNAAVTTTTDASSSKRNEQGESVARKATSNPSDSGSSGAPFVIGAVLVLAVGAGAGLLIRRRGGTAPS